MRSFIAGAYTTMCSLISPPRCLTCACMLSGHTMPLCNTCMERIQPVVSMQFQITPLYAMTVLACSDYTFPLARLIRAKAYSNYPASRALGHLIWHLTAIAELPVDVLVPVPLHWTRYAVRGYNQAYEIACVLASYKKIPVVSLVHRTSATHFQYRLSRSTRQENVQAAFSLNATEAAVYYNKHIVIVDDLMTSGATLRAVAHQLIPLKPASLTAVVACRVV